MILNSRDELESQDQGPSLNPAKPKILLLDDDKFYCVLFERYNRKIADIEYTTNLKAFFKLLRNEEFDLLIIDYDLRSTTCIDILEPIHRIIKTPVAVISSSTSHLDYCQHSNPPLEGVMSYISKWEEPETILKKALLDRYSKKHKAVMHS